MKLKKSVLALAGAAALMSSQALSADDKLTLGISQYPSTLHPIIDSMVAKTYTHGFTFRDTIGFDQQWKLMCFLCEEVPSFENGIAVVVDRPHAKEGESEKGVKITVKFKKDLFWGDGTPITTKDVKFWYDVATSSEVQGNAGLSTYQHMEKLEVVDDYTVNVYVDRVSYKYNAYYIPSVLPRHVEESVFNANPKEYHLKTKYVTDPTNAALYNEHLYY